MADDESVCTFKSITAQARTSFQTLAILKTSQKVRQAQDPKAFTDRCPSLERFCAGLEYITTDLKAFGPALRALSVALFGPEELPLIARTCPQLRELTLFHSWIDLTPIWKACGQRLEKVYFQVGISSVEENIDSLQQHCRALKSIHINGNVDFSLYFGRLARLYSSYGDQLENVFLPSYITEDAAVCQQIAEACPNVQIAMDNRDYLPAGMKFLGHLLRRAHVVVFSPKERDDVIQSWEYCTNISDLKVRFPRGTSSDVHMLQELCRPTLQELVIRGATGDVDEVFCSMAARTGRLRRFIYEGEMPGMKALQTFIARNPNLEQVDVSFVKNDGADRTEEDQDFEELMNAFSHRNELREFIIGSFPGIVKGKRFEFVADACNFLRHREVHVHVCGVDYLA